MLPGLTDRENQILELIANGLTNREIACNLSISEATVENHIHHIFVKLRISNRVQAVAHAYRSKIMFDQSDLSEMRANSPNVRG